MENVSNKIYITYLLLPVVYIHSVYRLQCQLSGGMNIPAPKMSISGSSSRLSRKIAFYVWQKYWLLHDWLCGDKFKFCLVLLHWERVDLLKTGVILTKGMYADLWITQRNVKYSYRFLPHVQKYEILCLRFYTRYMYETLL